MVVYIVVIATVFVLSFGLILLILGGRSRESTRLIEVTGGTTPGYAPGGKTMLASLLDSERVSKVVQPLRGLLGSREDPDLVRRLASAGYRKTVHADIYFLVRILLPAVALVLGLLLIRHNAFFWVAVLAAAAFMVPDLWLMTAISRRREQIRLSLPDALDLLVICMEAGLGLDQAILRVGQELKISHPALSEEFMLIGLEQRAGKPRLDAWRNMADRVGVESVRQFVQMLVQTERFGTPISKSLGTFADSLRVRRRQQAEEMAAKTTIKMIPPLVLFIFPNLFIVLLGPAAIMIWRNLARVMTGG
ncbi:MAG: type II secretion system F family protein [Acidobacteriia bacterium]|nr:type II secretion system F family protein [Terriglobia bacterium]